MIYGGEGYLRYAKPDPANPTGPWMVHTISERDHGAPGTASAWAISTATAGMDILNAYGWWEQPPAGSEQELWKYHPQAFGRWTGHASPAAPRWPSTT